MKKIIGIFFALSLIGCVPHYHFIVLEKDFFGVARADSAKIVADHWAKIYGCGKAIVLSPLKNPDPNEIEHAIPGHIYYSGQRDLKSVILHAMTNAVKPKKPTMLVKKFSLGEDTVIGFHGLNLIVKTSRGEKTQFTKIEEGVAERAAIFAGLGYESYSLQYENIGTVTKNRFPKGCRPEPVSFVQKNDVYGYVAEFLGKKRGDVNFSDLVKVALVYQRAWDMTTLIPNIYIY